MRILTVDIYEKEKNFLLEEFESTDSGYICVTSVHGLIEAYENNEINEAFKNSFANVPDGMPIVYFSRVVRKVNMSRITGPEFIYDFLEILDRKSKSIVTIGSNESTIKNFKKFLDSNYKSINLVNSNYSIINTKNNSDIQEVINFCKNNKADYYMIFLSTPKQDMLMYQMSKQLDVKMIGFGAAVDYLVGNTKYAPRILQVLALEWLYRLFQEPKRLFKRYFNIIPKFFIYLFISSFSKKKQ